MNNACRMLWVFLTIALTSCTTAEEEGNEILLDEQKDAKTENIGFGDNSDPRNAERRSREMDAGALVSTNSTRDMDGGVSAITRDMDARVIAVSTDASTGTQTDSGTTSLASDVGMREMGAGAVRDANALIDIQAVHEDASPPTDVPFARDAMVDATVVRTPEICNGLDDDKNGQVDEIFLCQFGRIGPNCITSCGSSGFRRCEAPTCQWSERCYPFTESCDNTIDDDCDGNTDCADADCASSVTCLTSMRDAGTNIDTGAMDSSSITDASAPIDASPIEPSVPVVYEFMVNEPVLWDETFGHELRDEHWLPQTCLNTRNTTMQALPQLDRTVWHRCTIPRMLPIFTGRFRSRLPWHPGDLATIYDATPGRTPPACTLTPGVSWRIYERDSGRSLIPITGLRMTIRHGACRHSF